MTDEKILKELLNQRDWQERAVDSEQKKLDGYHLMK